MSSLLTVKLPSLPLRANETNEESLAVTTLMVAFGNTFLEDVSTMEPLTVPVCARTLDAISNKPSNKKAICFMYQNCVIGDKVQKYCYKRCKAVNRRGYNVNCS